VWNSRRLFERNEQGFALGRADIETFDQPVLKPKNVTDHLIDKEIAVQVAHAQLLDASVGDDLQGPEELRRGRIRLR